MDPVSDFILPKTLWCDFEYSGWVGSKLLVSYIFHHVMVQPSPSRIVHCYGEYQKLFANYPQMEFRRGLPDFEDFDGSEPVLLVIDDLMNETD